MKIGLTHTGNAEKHKFYVDWLKANEDIEIIKLSAEDKNLAELNKCDGLVLSGGIDIHPRFYGNDVTNYDRAPETFNEPRDEFEMAAYQLAQENNMPVLGICRGMQLINIIHKGTMLQDLGEKKLVDTHIGNPDKSHLVKIKPGTLLSGIVNNDTAQINSAHHQAIDKLGAGLVVNAISGDGIVEGIERKDPDGKPFLLAIQWHPERMFRFGLEDSATAAAIRQRFIDEVKKSINENH
jgi:putative glutamine amidotransferase